VDKIWDIMTKAGVNLPPEKKQQFIKSLIDIGESTNKDNIKALKALLEEGKFGTSNPGYAKEYLDNLKNAVQSNIDLDKKYKTTLQRVADAFAKSYKFTKETFKKMKDVYGKIANTRIGTIARAIGKRAIPVLVILDLIGIGYNIIRYTFEQGIRFLKFLNLEQHPLLTKGKTKYKTVVGPDGRRRIQVTPGEVRPSFDWLTLDKNYLESGYDWFKKAFPVATKIMPEGFQKSITTIVDGEAAGKDKLAEIKKSKKGAETIEDALAGLGIKPQDNAARPSEPEYHPDCCPGGPRAGGTMIAPKGRSTAPPTQRFIPSMPKESIEKYLSRIIEEEINAVMAK